MKRFLCACLVLLLFAVSAVSDAEELKVLMIGNSFTQSLIGMLEPVVESVPDCKIVLENMYIGGCSMERHWKNIAAEEANREDRYFPEFTYREKLESRDWDFVSIHQKSGLSWRPETYLPWAENLTDYIHRYAPGAEVVMQQTWSYRPDDERLAEWNLTQDEMSEKIIDANRQVSEKLGLRVIPVGLAIKTARAEQPGGYQPFNPADYTYPDLPSLKNFFVGSVSWSDDHTKIEGDSYHLNQRGRYLQACVWFAFLYGRSAEEVSYVPAGMSEDDAVFLRKIADKALREYR